MTRGVALAVVLLAGLAGGCGRVAADPSGGQGSSVTTPAHPVRVLALRWVGPADRSAPGVAFGLDLGEIERLVPGASGAVAGGLGGPIPPTGRAMVPVVVGADTLRCLAAAAAEGDDDDAVLLIERFAGGRVATHRLGPARARAALDAMAACSGLGPAPPLASLRALCGG